MTTRDTPWPEGTPAWVDLMVPDRRRAQDFYGALFGWDFAEGAPETGYYTQASVDGRVVAGIGEPQPGQPAPPPAWTTYIAVDDVDRVTEKAREAGAAVLMEPMDVMEFGRMAVLADPTGAVFGLWQSGSHTGMRLANEPGSVTWNEVLTRDVDGAQDFYRTVFGYSYGDMSSEQMRYATMDLDGSSCAGIGDVPPGVSADVPAHWQTYFAVPDADAAAATVRSHGGQVLHEPMDTPYGRMVIAAGPFGEVFGLMGPPPQPAGEG